MQVLLTLTPLIQDALKAAQARLDHSPDMMRIRRATAEHPFSMLKAWLGSTHFLTKTLNKVSTEEFVKILELIRLTTMLHFLFYFYL